MTSEQDETGDSRRVDAGLELLEMACDDIKASKRLSITIAFTVTSSTSSLSW
jgi:hypothetical protein